MRPETRSRLSPWLGGAAALAALVPLVMLALFSKAVSVADPDWNTARLVTHGALGFGLLAVGLSIAARWSGGLSRPWRVAMTVAIIIGVSAVVAAGVLELVYSSDSEFP
jgi:hypothetical protein